MELPSVRFVQGEPDCYPLKDYKCPCTGERKKSVFICEIPLEERHKYIDPSQDINDPRMKVMGHCVNELDSYNTQQKEIDGLNTTINAMLEHLKQLTTAVNKISK
jgi:hypothetical protein